MCVGGYEVRPPFNLGVIQGMPLGPDSAFHARIMHMCVIVLERLGLFSTESGDKARWSVYIDDGSGGLRLVTRNPSDPDFATQFCGVIGSVYACLSVWQSFAKAFWALTLFFYLNIIAVDGHRLPKGYQISMKSDAHEPGRLTGLRKKIGAAFATCNAVLVGRGTLSAEAVIPPAFVAAERAISTLKLSSSPARLAALLLAPPHLHGYGMPRLLSGLSAPSGNAEASFLALIEKLGTCRGCDALVTHLTKHLFLKRRKPELNDILASPGLARAEGTPEETLLARRFLARVFETAPVHKFWRELMRFRTANNEHRCAEYIAKSTLLSEDGPDKFCLDGVLEEAQTEATLRTSIDTLLMKLEGSEVGVMFAWSSEVAASRLARTRVGVMFSLRCLAKNRLAAATRPLAVDIPEGEESPEALLD